MDLSGLEWLLTGVGQQVLADLAADERFSEAALAGYASRLRRLFPASAVQAALEVALCRRKAVGKFPAAERLYFTREALEQATPWRVSAYRAHRFANAGRVLDLCCSVGGDALPLAALTAVVAVDRDPVRLALLRANAMALGVNEAIETCEADATVVDGMGCDAVFFDPARRIDGKRIFNVEQYQPPLSTLRRWADRPLRAAKVAPGIADEQVPTDAGIEFIGLDGELREATLWWGNLRPQQRIATLLSSQDGAFHQLEADPACPTAPLSEPLRYLYEPDAAVIRAHAVADLAGLLDAAQFDRDIAFLTSNQRQASPFARVWEIETVLPFNLNNLRKALQERNIGRITVKKRGSPIQPEELIRRLKLRGSQECVVVLTQVFDAPTVLICRTA